jgi:hypothetical protein
MKFEIVIKSGNKTACSLKGLIDLRPADFTSADMENIFKTEKLLERLTGYRFHINCYHLEDEDGTTRT